MEGGTWEGRLFGGVQRLTPLDFSTLPPLPTLTAVFPTSATNGKGPALTAYTHPAHYFSPSTVSPLPPTLDAGRERERGAIRNGDGGQRTSHFSLNFCLMDCWRMGRGFNEIATCDSAPSQVYSPLQVSHRHTGP